jgi:transcriptional regulator with GAF, ATPase, and Fis domain
VIAESEVMRALLSTVRKVAPSTASVLLLGETGTGKEVIAKELHQLSPRASKPFEVVDCGSLSPNLINAELLGHERGAFTGAVGDRPGAFERADGGTVLLDEIGELPLDLQPALLGVLERRRFRRIGGSRERAVDVRVVSATHRDLSALVAAGRFRADLLYRLNVVTLAIPPLRDRREDIGPLVRHFAPGLEADPVLLAAHHWPGNVRELRNVVEGAVVTGEWRIGGSCTPSSPASASKPLQDYGEARRAAVEAFQRAYLPRLLQESGGKVAEAARRSGMDRPYLHRLLRELGLR